MSFHAHSRGSAEHHRVEVRVGQGVGAVGERDPAQLLDRVVSFVESGQLGGEVLVEPGESLGDHRMDDCGHAAEVRVDGHRRGIDGPGERTGTQPVWALGQPGGSAAATTSSSLLTFGGAGKSTGPLVASIALREPYNTVIGTRWSMTKADASKRSRRFPRWQEFGASAAVVRRFLNIWPPFAFTGVRVVHLSDDFREARVRLGFNPLNRNYVGTQFGGSLLP